MQQQIKTMLTSASQVFNDLNGAPNIIIKGADITHGPIDRDVQILSMLTAASACMSKTYGVYAGKKVFANMFLYIVGQPASGKGRMGDIRFLTKNIDLLYEECYDAPFLLPANTTEMSFARAIYKAQNSQLLVDTESDTIACTFNNKTNSFSSMARKIAQHEPIDFSRCAKNDKVVRYKIDSPRISMALSGTPDQLKNLFSNPGNGYFSRHIFYVINPDKDWHDPFLRRAGEISDEQFMSKLGNQLSEMAFKHMSMPHEVEVILPPKLQKEFNEKYKPRHEDMWECENTTLVGCIDRQGLNAFRMMMVVESLKCYEAGKEWPDRLKVSQQTFDFVMNAMPRLFEHTELVYDYIVNAPTENPNATIIEELQKVQGQQFTTIELMAATGKERRSANRLITKLIDSGLIIKLAKGLYQKTTAESPQTEV